MWHVIQNICILVQQFPAINKTDNTVLRSMKITVKKLQFLAALEEKLKSSCMQIFRLSLVAVLSQLFFECN
jgi:hypothetical protein